MNLLSQNPHNVPSLSFQRHLNRLVAEKTFHITLDSTKLTSCTPNFRFDLFFSSSSYLSLIFFLMVSIVACAQLDNIV